MKRIVLSCLAPLALLSTPTAAIAQSSSAGSEPDGEALAAMFTELFTSEPLTAEQEARLPLATRLVAKVMPEGFYAEMMADTLDGVLAPMMGAMPQAMPPSELALRLGQPLDVVLELSEEDRATVASIVDPQFRQRFEAGMDYMMEEMVKQVVQFEPFMREGLSRAYAVRFSEAQLEDIGAFFETETGAVYASESMRVFTDPQVMSASMQAMPMMLEELPRIMGEMEARMSSVGKVRSFEDLSGAERERLAALLGVKVESLRQSMSEATQSGAQ